MKQVDFSAVCGLRSLLSEVMVPAEYRPQSSSRMEVSYESAPKIRMEVLNSVALTYSCIDREMGAYIFCRLRTMAFFLRRAGLDK